MKKGMLVLAALVATLAPTSASAAVRGFVAVGRPFGFAGYGGWWGPYWGPYWGPAWGGYYTPGMNSGEVKLDTKTKDASVYINGAYAGPSGKLKTMYLRPGSYAIELRAQGRPNFAEKVYVVAGKTIHLRPEF